MQYVLFCHVGTLLLIYLVSHHTTGSDSSSNIYLCPDLGHSVYKSMFLHLIEQIKENVSRIKFMQLFVYELKFDGEKRIPFLSPQRPWNTIFHRPTYNNLQIISNWCEINPLGKEIQPIWELKWHLCDKNLALINKEIFSILVVFNQKSWLQDPATLFNYWKNLWRCLKICPAQTCSPLYMFQDKSRVNLIF